VLPQIYCADWAIPAHIKMFGLVCLSDRHFVSEYVRTYDKSHIIQALIHAFQSLT
jgi:hypothetical protein